MESPKESATPRYEEIVEANGISLPDHFQDKLFLYLFENNVFSQIQPILVRIFYNMDNNTILDFISALAEFYSEVLDEYLDFNSDAERNEMVEGYLAPFYATFIRFQQTRNRTF